LVIEFIEIHKVHNFSFLTTLFLRSLRFQLCAFALKINNMNNVGLKQKYVF